MRGDYPDSQIRMITVFPPGVQRETLQKILAERWKVKTVPAYLDDSVTLFRVFEVEGVPASVLFDAAGEMVKSFVGKPAETELRKAFDSVLK